MKNKELMPLIVCVGICFEMLETGTNKIFDNQRHYDHMHTFYFPVVLALFCSCHKPGPKFPSDSFLVFCIFVYGAGDIIRCGSITIITWSTAKLFRFIIWQPHIVRTGSRKKTPRKLDISKLARKK